MDFAFERVVRAVLTAAVVESWASGDPVSTGKVAVSASVVPGTAEGAVEVAAAAVAGVSESIAVLLDR